MNEVDSGSIGLVRMMMGMVVRARFLKVSVASSHR